MQMRGSPTILYAMQTNEVACWSKLISSDFAYFYVVFEENLKEIKFNPKVSEIQQW